MKFAPFEYRRPASLAELDACLEDDESRVLAGGQSLLALMAFRLARPRVLVDLAGVGELRGIGLEHSSGAAPGGSADAAGAALAAGVGASYLVVGAMTTHSELRASALASSSLPLLRRVAAEIGHPAIRNLGTIGGSLAHSDPAAEWPATCIALGAEVDIHSAAGGRRLLVDRLVLGPYETALEKGEVVRAVRFPLGEPRSGALAEVARRPGDFALAGAVCTVSPAPPGSEPHGERPAPGEGPVARGAVTLFGVTGRPLTLELPASLLAEPGAPERAQLRELLEPRLGDVLVDHQADASFRRHLAAVVAARAIRAARVAAVATPPGGAPIESAGAGGPQQ